MNIGVLALQGAFMEHRKMLESLHANVNVVEVRLPVHLNIIDGLIIPGGESTTISKLANAYHLIQPIQHFSESHPIWGTCAGMIFMAKHLEQVQQTSLEIMNIKVQRNAFGRQVDSFVTQLDVPELNYTPFPGIFIRAPAVVDYESSVQVLARLSDNTVVAVKEKHWLATSFHPELTDDNRFHQYFLDMIATTKKGV